TDYYHAPEGARLAQQTARQAHRTVGPQFAKPQTSSAGKARMLRGQNKPRRIMYPQRQPQNTARKTLAQVERKPSPSTRENKPNGSKGFKLTNNSISTLGQDWKSSDFKTGPLAPPPVTAVAKFKEPEWLTREKNMREMLGEPPLTSEEERMNLILDEFLE
ncbi:MAG: hypothetical protein K2H87_08925, partial [Duncaniella sp.]|nr:hypothetical protein [Duncaniella sp.]